MPGETALCMVFISWYKGRMVGGSSQIFLFGFLLDFYIRWMQLENTNKIKKILWKLDKNWPNGANFKKYWVQAKLYPSKVRKKQLKKCDRQVFSAFVHGFELPKNGEIFVLLISANVYKVF